MLTFSCIDFVLNVYFELIEKNFNMWNLAFKRQKWWMYWFVCVCFITYDSLKVSRYFVEEHIIDFYPNVQDCYTHKKRIQCIRWNREKVSKYVKLVYIILCQSRGQ